MYRVWMQIVLEHGAWTAKQRTLAFGAAQALAAYMGMTIVNSGFDDLVDPLDPNVVHLGFTITADHADADVATRFLYTIYRVQGDLEESRSSASGPDYVPPPEQ